MLLIDGDFPNCKNLQFSYARGRKRHAAGGTLQGSFHFPDLLYWCLEHFNIIFHDQDCCLLAGVHSVICCLLFGLCGLVVVWFMWNWVLYFRFTPRCMIFVELSKFLLEEALISRCGLLVLVRVIQNYLNLLRKAETTKSIGRNIVFLLRRKCLLIILLVTRHGTSVWYAFRFFPHVLFWLLRYIFFLFGDSLVQWSHPFLPL